ncbi:aldehyde dehydrogenase family protein [Tessaracoccus antarcticus]|uniref:Aldehyde dehydrogenase family protein n=1 Tax=Tessaracoccus antarcticus TaxID=2479848 RepID=A0A3M0G4V4_9ACTN|nr:aldehyde dehydrogenase family protein [Tessaracoccus antarcticus]RMB59608.1 aldehyde dehydrogenase family protein [Tessaracoccus antarcticus]
MTTFDRDLTSVQQARDLAVRSREAMRSFQFAEQSTVDRICEAMVAAAVREAARLGQLAHDETGFGYPDHKRLKNQFAAQGVWDSIKDVPTCGVLRRDDVAKVIEIGAPVGVLCALTPSTNPTSTAIFKVLIGVKARNGVVVSPHPSSATCTAEAVRVMVEAGEAAGMPEGLVSCMTDLTIQGTNELMNHHAVSMILATGGPGMVKAAHSCGKPALGVGPGNVPAYVDRSADVVKAAEMIVESKSFDCSTICATEQSVIADRPIAEQLKREMRSRGAHWLTPDEAEKLASRMFRPNGMMIADYVGRTPQRLGELAGIDVPGSARVLVADLEGVGPKFPLSREKLTSVLGFMVEDGWHAGCERSIQLLRFGGDGHSVVIHSRDEESIMAFGIEKPAFRILVNTWGSLGGVGFTTGIRPSMTLGPGGMGGAAVSDNITVEHVLNVKRIAYHLHDVDPAARTAHGGGAGSVPPAASPEADLIERVVRRVVEEMRR